MRIPPDGIYKSKSHGVNFHPDRNVYIQNGRVRLISDENKFVFAYSFFFDANTLGERISDLPDNFDIRTY